MSRSWQSAEGLQGRNVWLFLTPGSYLPGIAGTIFFFSEDGIEAEFNFLFKKHQTVLFLLHNQQSYFRLFFNPC